MGCKRPFLTSLEGSLAGPGGDGELRCGFGSNRAVMPRKTKKRAARPQGQGRAFAESLRLLPGRRRFESSRREQGREGPQRGLGGRPSWSCCPAARGRPPRAGPTEDCKRPFLVPWEG